MDLQQLRYFLAVADSLNISQAAEKLGVSQPALSKTMARLQQRVNVQLYVRKGRGVVLTDAGNALRGRAEAIIYRIDEAEQLMTDMRAGRSDHVRIGAGPSFLTQLLPEVLSELSARQPDVRYTIREGTIQTLYEWLKMREIDFALFGWVKSDYGRGESDAALTYHRLLVDELVIVTRNDHPLQRNPPTSIADLSRYNWVLPRMGTKLQTELNRVFLLKGEEVPVVNVLTSSLYTTLAFLRRTDMMTILARSALSEEDTAGIAALEQPWLSLQREAFLATLKGMKLPPAASTVTQKVRRMMA
ncbi:MAG: LysR family transcriptional regulator [Martelella sp.]|uniref:LysR family transcriptional regulator n=1 Tax=Martelella sp. TaxID=1969699 RepID=UPI00324201BD